jgi:hypothetical protein
VCSIVLQERLASAEVAEQRRVWGMSYRQHVLETFQLARHNQQQRQALYIGTLRRQALGMTVAEPASAPASRAGSRAGSVRVPSAGAPSVRAGSRGAVRRGSLLRFASIPEAAAAVAAAMAEQQAEPSAELPLQQQQGTDAARQPAEQQEAAAAPAQQAFVSPFISARRPSRLAAAGSALLPLQRSASDAAPLAALSAGAQLAQPSAEAVRSVRQVSGRLGSLMRWESERCRVASLPPVWAELARKSSMLSELHVG